jgi:Ca-activated chloride channel family protein
MNRRQGVILFSDGELLQGSLETALNQARSRGIAVSVVGLGSDQGGPVPVEISPASPDGFLLAPDGSLIISSRQENVLKNAAQKTSGLYVDANGNNAESQLTDHYRFLSSESAGGLRREIRDRWHLFVFAALVCLGLSRLLGFRRKKAIHTPLLLCIFSLVLSSCSQIQGKLLIMEGNFYKSQNKYAEAIASFLKAQIYPEAAPYAEYGLGLSYSSLEENDAALERYSASLESLNHLSVDKFKGEHRELGFRLSYNIGIIYFEQSDYSGAAEYFRQALEIDSSRLEAKRNLELSLLAMSRPNQNETTSASTDARTGAQGSQALFDYLRVKEQEQWKSREWSENPESQGPDY